MKKNFLVVFLIALVTTMASLTAFAVNEERGEVLLSPAPIYEGDLIQEEVTQVADNTIKVQLDGEIVDFTDAEGNVVNPQIVNGRTMVPMRKIFEIFDAEVTWKDETRTVIATTGEKEISLTINSDKATVKDLISGEDKEITLDSTPVILNSRTMVPVRFIAESLEKEVGWDNENRTVVIIDFEKIEKELEEKLPALKEIFALELEPVESFKTTSEINGKFVYKDPADKSNNETVKLDGTLEFDKNQENEMKMDLDLALTGNGVIYDSIKEADLEKIESKFIMTKEAVYMMMKQDGKEVWANFGSGVDLSELDTLKTQNVKSYEEFTEVLKTTAGELDVETYNVLEEAIDILSNIYSEENFKITGTGNNKTLKLTVDLTDLMAQPYSDDSVSGILEGGKMTLSVVEKINNKKVNSAKITLEIYFQEVDTKESVELDLNMNMKFTSVNKDFDIAIPKVVVE